MLPVLRPATRPLSRVVNVNSRSFVSTLLLSKSWDNETVVDLKKELKKRGLTSSGNKPILIARLSEHDEQQQREALASPQVRKASTTPTRPTDIPGIPNIPPPPPNSRLDYLAPVLPDLAPRLVIESAPVPFVPDFWDSSKVKAKEQQEPTESDNPKVLALSGVATNFGDGPSHVFYFEADSTPSDSSREVSLFKKEGFWHDVFNDSGLPTAVKVPSVNFETQDVPRTDSTSARGGWTLVGLLLGSWVVAGLAAPKPETEEEVHH